jgi:glyoxylase-like metal-dependent hydrolase (beta-lactamase superfamily II)
MDRWICATCAVEYPGGEEPPQRCPICEDERQYVPETGQVWTTLDRLAGEGHRVEIGELEPGLHGITAIGRVGIGQTAKLVQTSAGNLLWDPTGYVDDAALEKVRDLGGVAYVVASHPHMYGVQTAWAHALGARVLVAEADREWLQRPDDTVEFWGGTRELLPGVTIETVGGHFPGSAIARWDGADGRGVVLAGDTFFPGPTRRWVTFMRSYPNSIPLSAAVVERIARAVTARRFDRAYGNFANVIPSDAAEAVRRSADRYIAWVSGEHDELT